MDDTAKPSLKLELGLYILLLKVSKHLQIRPLVTFKPHSLKLLLDLLLAVEPDSETPVFVPSHHQITELLKHENSTKDILNYKNLTRILLAPFKAKLNQRCLILKMLPLDILFIIDDMLSPVDKFAFRLSCLDLYHSLRPCFITSGMNAMERRSIAILAKTHPSVIYQAMEREGRLNVGKGWRNKLYYCHCCSVPHSRHQFEMFKLQNRGPGSPKLRSCRFLSLCPHVSISLRRLQAEVATLRPSQPVINLGVCGQCRQGNQSCFSATIDRGMLICTTTTVVNLEKFHTGTVIQREYSLIREQEYLFEWSPACPHIRASSWTELRKIAMDILKKGDDVKNGADIPNSEETDAISCSRTRKCECVSTEPDIRQGWRTSDGGLGGRCGFARTSSQCCSCRLTWKIVNMPEKNRFDVIFTIHRQMVVAGSTTCTEWLREISRRNRWTLDLGIDRTTRLRVKDDYI